MNEGFGPPRMAHHSDASYAAQYFHCAVRYAKLAWAYWECLNDSVSKWLTARNADSLQDIFEAECPYFFETLTLSLQHDAMLALVRLMDNVYSQNNPNKPNMVVDRVIRDCRSTLDVAEQAEVDRLRLVVSEHEKMLKDWRHKAYAHADYTIAVNNSAVVIPDSLEIRETIDALDQIGLILGRQYPDFRIEDLDMVDREVDRLTALIAAGRKALADQLKP